jgi:outer membrane lipoprotein-sorting protein
MKAINLKRIFIAAFAVLAIFFFNEKVYARHNAVVILDGIQKRYSHLAGCRISYTREVITRSMSMLGNKLKGDTATGDIFFAPPCLIRLEQKTPRREIIAGNENTIWWYIPEKSCVYIYPSNRFGKELSLLSDIFSGLVDVNKKLASFFLAISSALIVPKVLAFIISIGLENLSINCATFFGPQLCSPEMKNF